MKFHATLACLFCGLPQAVAQPVPAKQRDALVSVILEELKPQEMVSVERGPDGKYHYRPMQRVLQIRGAGFGLLHL
ncbi:hypothetical protein [Hymenobacter elongatus]|nr:hypothetical protein [Hymenobacter elongatus]